MFSQSNRFIATPEALRRLEIYRQKLIKKEVQPGPRFQKELAKQGPLEGPLSALSFEEFMVALVNTKASSEAELATLLKEAKPQWTKDERAILGDFTVHYRSPVDRDKVQKFDLAQGVHLNETDAPDYLEVVKEGQLDEEAYYQLWKRRLLPLLHNMNSAGEDVVVYLESGFMEGAYTRPEFKEKVGPLLQKSLKRLLREEGGAFTRIKGFYLGNNQGLVEKEKIGGILFHTFPPAQQPGFMEEQADLGTFFPASKIQPLNQLLWATVFDLDKKPKTYDPRGGKEGGFYVYSPNAKHLVKITGNQGLGYLAPLPEEKEQKRGQAAKPPFNQAQLKPLSTRRLWKRKQFKHEAARTDLMDYDYLYVAGLTLLDFAKDFKDTIKPYKSKWYIGRDALQLFRGIGNFFVGLAHLLVVPLVCMLMAVGFTLEYPFRDKKKGDPSFGKIWASLAVDALKHMAGGLVLMLRGLTQIATAALTLVFRIPLRLMLTKKWQPLEENKGYKNLLGELNRVVTVNGNDSRVETRRILSELQEKSRVAESRWQTASPAARQAVASITYTKAALSWSAEPKPAPGNLTDPEVQQIRSSLKL